LYFHSLITIALALSAIVNVYGNQLKNSTDTSSSLSELDEMVISGCREGTASASTKNLLTEDFSGKFQDLATLLRTVSVTVYRNGVPGACSSIQIRGSSSNQVQIFLDGIPLNSESGGAVDIGKIPLGSLQEITIHKSSAPLELIGSNEGAVIELWRHRVSGPHDEGLPPNRITLLKLGE